MIGTTWHRLFSRPLAVAVLAASLFPSLGADWSDGIEAELERRHIPGAAVAIVEAGKTTHVEGFGLANVKRKIPVAGDTQFLIGSLSKPFIGLVVLQLSQQGKLGLDDPASKHLPSLSERYAGVTVRQLLTHTAGIARDAKKKGPKPYYNHQLYGSKLIEFLESAEIVFEPGKGAGYSNLGTALAALIAESASGEPIDLLIERMIFRPLEMKSTRHLRPEDDPRELTKLASGYYWNGKKYREAEFESRFPTGSIVSSVQDLARLAEAIQSGELVDKSELKTMLAVPWLSEEIEAKIGEDGAGRIYRPSLGWFVHEDDDLMHHGGAVEGYSSQFDLYLASKRAVIVLCNNESGTAGDIAWMIGQSLAAQAP